MLPDKCARCDEPFAWSNGEALIVNGEEFDFCGRACLSDYMADNDLVTIVDKAAS